MNDDKFEHCGILLSCDTVQRITGCSTDEIRQLIRTNDFPQPIEMPGRQWTRNISRAKWLTEEIQYWLHQIIARREKRSNLENSSVAIVLTVPRRFQKTIEELYSTKIEVTKLFSIKEHYYPAGVYFLFQGKNIVYIGKAKNLCSRISTHAEKLKGRFDGFSFIECFDRNWRSYLEGHYVRVFSPAINAAVPRLDGELVFSDD